MIIASPSTAARFAKPYQFNLNAWEIAYELARLDPARNGRGRGRVKSINQARINFVRMTDYDGDLDRCITWQGAIDKAGYGRVKASGKVLTAHRRAHQLFVGPTLDHYVCHTCDRRECISPAHLFLGTPGDNMRDAAVKRRLRNAYPPIPPETVFRIYEMVGLGLGVTDISRELEMHHAAVSQIASGQSRRAERERYDAMIAAAASAPMQMELLL